MVSGTEGLLAGMGFEDRSLTDAEVRRIVADSLERIHPAGKRVLVIIPDGTRTAPVPLLFQLFDELLAGRAKTLDYLVALGTHPLMDDQALGRLIGVPVRAGRAGRARIFNHRWDCPETFVELGRLPAGEVEEISQGRLSLEVPVRLNRLVLEYDQLIVCGPVFPHEVVGFSGGNKYFFPGVGGQEIINVTHWLGALMTNAAVNGVADTPVRRMIDRAARFVPTPRLCLAMVMHGQSLAGLYAGSMESAWRAATELSARVDIQYVDKPYHRVLSIMPAMYEDLWTAAKGMYKVEPAIADGGEVTIYAPHITQVSYTHGDAIAKVGYHVRDYFLAQWPRFREYPWAILAHSTHLRGGGTYENGLERPRIRVSLATGIDRQTCNQIGLDYVDPASIRLEEWQGREREGVLVIPRAGEVLYRCRPAGK